MDGGERALSTRVDEIVRGNPRQYPEYSVDTSHRKSCHTIMNSRQATVESYLPRSSLTVIPILGIDFLLFGMGSQSHYSLHWARMSTAPALYSGKQQRRDRQCSRWHSESTPQELSNGSRIVNNYCFRNS